MILYYRSEDVIDTHIHEGRTFIVFESALMQLFRECTSCNRKCTNISKTVIGSFLRITQKCIRCNHTFIWNSQPFVGGTPAGNILTSAAILYTGLIPAKALRVFKVLGCATISRKTFFRHQMYYLHPATDHIWKQEQKTLLEKMKTEKKKLIIGGDGRADSPGHSAKYGTYSALELTCNKIIDFQVVQVRMKKKL